MSNVQFKSVHNVLGSPTVDMVGHVRATELNAQSAKLGPGSFTSGGLEVGRIIAYPHTGFTSAAAGSYTLNTRPGAALATASSTGDAAVLPVGARLTKVVVDGRGSTIAGPTSFNVGHAALNTDSTAALDTVTVANINSQPMTRLFNINATGAAGVAVEGTAVTSSTQYVNLTVTGGAVTAGDLRVLVEYAVFA